jgi:WXG100 family type VII secretion target
MAMALRVNLEHLAVSAAQITDHGEDLASSHLSADNRIADAQAGWTGRSAEALAERVPRWTANSTKLVTRMGEHASDFYSVGQAFSAMEETNAEKLKTVARRQHF